MPITVDQSIQSVLNERLSNLEKHYNADFLSYFGPIVDGNETIVRRIVDQLATCPGKKDILFVLLTTNGGSPFAVERYVNIIRHHYHEVNFIVPDYAYSAGTIFCMSGDNIHMDYSSVLGPIDPQIQNKEGKWVPALGYLDKVNEFIEKSRSNVLTTAEFLILKDFDLAELRAYEQAKELTIELLKKWLVKYKFKNWNTHQTTPGILGTPVTPDEKQERAEIIAGQLSDNSKWKSHGRPINIEALKGLKLKIEDFSTDPQASLLIRKYFDLLQDYITKNKIPVFIHTRKFI